MTRMFKKFWEYMLETYLNKLLALAMVSFGYLTAQVGNDGTFLVFALIFSIPLFITKKNWIY